MAVLDSNVHQQSDRLDDTDRYLVDYASAALKDATLHTDARMRFQAALAELVHDVMPEAQERTVTPEDGEPAKMLAAVLLDPNLATDSRMRLHEQIPELVSAAHSTTPRPAAKLTAAEPTQPESTDRLGPKGASRAAAARGASGW